LIVALRRGICSDSLTHVSKGRVLFFQLADIMSIAVARDAASLFSGAFAKDY
jgi:hypothetical protein